MDGWRVLYKREEPVTLVAGRGRGLLGECR